MMQPFEWMQTPTMDAQSNPFNAAAAALGKRYLNRRSTIKGNAVTSREVDAPPPDQGLYGRRDDMLQALRGGMA